MYKLYSLRWSVSRGWQWIIERDGMPGRVADHWLSVYKNDEPRVQFVISKSARKPRIPDMRSARERAPTILGR